MRRFLFYSHDSYGLGHFRRSSLLAAALTGSDPGHEVLLVTGSPRAQSFRLPDRVDTIKLPTATKADDGSYMPRKLGGGINSLVRLRSTLITAAAMTYAPDVIVVDHAPAGMQGELLPVLERLGASGRRPALVLGLRDVIDDPAAVDRAWRRDGIWDVLDGYDEILVYGDRSVRTTADELRLDERCSATVTHTGYLAPVMPEAMAGEPYILVTTGGGGDGHNLLRRYFDAVEEGATGGTRSVVVTGPLLSARRRAELTLRAERNPSIELVEFAPHMRELIGSAAGVISMAGYNTVVEELAAGVPALLVPRRTPRLEQHVRATRLSGRSGLEHCTVEHLSPVRVGRFVERCLGEERAETTLDLGGIHAATRIIERASHTERPHTHVHA